MQSKLKKTLLTFSIIIFLLVCILAFFLFREIQNNIKTSEQTQVDLQKEISKREEIKNFNDSFKLIEQDKALLETHFAQSSNIVPFLNTIEKMAQSVGTKAEVSFIEVAKDKTGLVIEMKDTGTFSQIYKFIMLLENSPYELEFTSVEMRNLPKENSKKNTWEVLFKLKLISFI